MLKIDSQISQKSGKLFCKLESGKLVRKIDHELRFADC